MRFGAASALLALALGPTAAAAPLPLLRDDGASYVDVRAAAAFGSDQGISDTSQAIDVAAQAMVAGAVGVYGAVGGARAGESYYDDVPPGMQVDEHTMTPLDAELGAVMRVHDDRGRALALRAGVSLPAVVDSDILGGPARLHFDATDPLDDVRAENHTSLRAAIEPSLRRGGFILAGTVGVDDAPDATHPVRIDLAAAIGGETGGGTSVVGAVGGFRALGTSPLAHATSVVVGLDVAHRFGATTGYAGLRAGTSPTDTLVGALIAGARWSL